MEEFAWVTTTLCQIDKGSKYLPATRVSNALIEIREEQFDPWDVIAYYFGKAWLGSE